MFCPNCGKEAENGAAFCENCGKPLCGAEPEQTPRNSAEAQWNAAQTPAYPDSAAPQMNAVPPEAKKKSHVGLVIGLAAAATILCGTMVAGALTNWFGLAGGPAQTICRAIQKTAAQNSGTIEIDCKIAEDTSSNYDDSEGTSQRTDSGEITGTVQWTGNRKERELSINAEYTLSAGGMEQNCVLALYNGYLIYSIGDGTYAVDVSKKLDALFDNLEDCEEQDWEDLDWEEVLDEGSEGAYEEASEYIDFDALNQCLKEYWNCLNDTGWLEENAGYSCERDGSETVYSFKLPLEKFLPATLEKFRGAFRNADDYNKVTDTLKEKENVLSSVQPSFSVSLQDGMLSSVQMKAEYENIQADFRCTYSKIGETEVDTEKLEALLDSAEKTDMSESELPG